MVSAAFSVLTNPAHPADAMSGRIHPAQLTCEYMENPSVVDEMQPRLAWVNRAEDGERGQRQTAWQVRVASTPDRLATPDLWDSQKVSSSQSTRVPYAGRPLRSREDCWWQVRVWDRDDHPSEWSAPARWSMGLLNPVDWKATWIGAPWQGEEALPKPRNPHAPLEHRPPPAPLLRKEFSIDRTVVRARAYVTGLGYFEFYVNGHKIGDEVLVPNQTNYGKRDDLMEQNIPLPDNFHDYRVMYLAYDITEHLREGSNVLGAILGNGFYNASKYWAGSYGSPRFLGQVHLTYSDGSEEVIASDQSWKAARSPILMDMVYYGEDYDARLEQPGWNKPGFDDSAWEPVAKRKAPFGRLVAHTAPPDRITERLQPVSIEKLPDGTHRVDFGVEISGWVRLNNVRGPAGHKISIKFLSNQYSGDNTYTFRGDGPESYAPRFNWFVFSGVEISNWPGELKPEHLTAEAVNTDVRISADFETSEPLFNAINRIWQRSQIDNMHGGLASDCPHRERAGYTGDGQVACITVLHNFDARGFYQKWIHDMRDAQIVDTGYVPNGAPWEPGCGGGPAWGAAICIMPWEFYLHYGSRDMLEDNFEAMKGYVRYMGTWVNDDGIMHSQRVGRDGEVLRWFNLGEWSGPSREMVHDEMVHTFYYWRCADRTALAAEALGRADEAARYRTLADKTRTAFQKRFFDASRGTYGDKGGNIFALKMGVPAEQQDRVLAAMRADIEANDGHLDTGIFGTRFFFDVLADYGMHELAYNAMRKTTRPSYGYWLEQGATTTREGWGDGGSHNHPMFGGGLVWYYRKLAGMDTDPKQPGYRHAVYRPMPVGDLTFARYFNETSFGRAGIHWERKDGRFSMEVVVPVGCTATVHVPTSKPKEVREGSAPASKVDHVKSRGTENGYSVFEVESGVYTFSCPVDGFSGG